MDTHNMMKLMPEVLAALKATGQNVSLAKDLEAAIAHDRKGRSEPFLWYRPRPGAEAHPGGRCYDIVFSDPHDTRFFPLYRNAPQPAEPVKVPSFRDIISFSDKWSKEPGFCEFERNNFVGCVREILARYGQPAVSVEPIAWESVTPAYRKYVTESAYQRLSAKAKQWYKPYRCSSCDTSAESAEPVAWMVPSLATFKDAIRTDCPPDTQEKLEGTVLWSLSIVGDMPPVTDKHGVTHHPRALVYRDSAPTENPS